MSNTSPVDAALRTLEIQIGFPPDSGNPETIYQSQKSLVVQWGLLQGLDKRSLEKSSLVTLGKIYGIKRYRDAVLREERRDPKNYHKNKKSGDLNLDIEQQTEVKEIPYTLPEEDDSPHQYDPGLSYDYIIDLIEKKLAPVWDALDLNTTNNQKLQEKIIDAVARKLEIEITDQKQKFETDLNRFKEITYDDTIKLVPSLVQQILDKSIPRKLIIKTSTKQITLPAEPRHKIFDEALTWLESGEHLYLVGPAGTGKTHLGKQLAQATELEFLPMPQALTKYELSGFLDGSGIYRGTIFRQAVEFGGLLVMDEIDINGASAIAFANSVMANGYCAFPDKTIQAHKDLKIVACANTFGRGASKEYIGRNPLDAASLDRFAYLICDYDEDMERQIFGNIPWVSYVQACRKATQELKLQHIVSMRAIARGKRGLNANLPLEKILFSSLWRGLDKDQILKIENLAGKFQEITTPKPRAMSRQHENFLEQFITHLQDNEKINAIKILRQAQSEMYGISLGLKQAKDYVEDLINNYEFPQSIEPIQIQAGEYA